MSDRDSTNKTPLKPCPFCGGEANISEHAYDWWAHCADCGVGYWSRFFGGSASDLRERWNRRATEQAIRWHESDKEMPTPSGVEYLILERTGYDDGEPQYMPWVAVWDGEWWYDDVTDEVITDRHGAPYWARITQPE